MLVSAMAFGAACDQIPGVKPKDDAGAHTNPTDLITKPVTDIDDVASVEPGLDRRQWRANSQPAREQTGSVTTSVASRAGPLMLAFESGITVTAERDLEVKASTPVGAGGQTFSALMGVDPSARVFVYRVAEERMAPTAAARGGLCRTAKTSFVAVSEFVGRDGAWALRVASFTGAAAPGGGNAPDLCNAFQYAAA